MTAFTGIRRAACIAVTLIGGLAAALAQERLSAISGTVKDANGGLVPGAAISIVQVETGLVRKLNTNAEGAYRAASLELGEYAVTAAQAGFKTNSVKGVFLEVDHEAIVEHTLTVGDRSEVVVIDGEARTVEATLSAVSSVIDSKTIDQLPLNGRDYVQLATLEAGAPAARAQTRDINNGYGVQLSIAGSRPNQNNFRLDGVSLTSYNGSTPGSVNGVNLGVDAIREFSIQGSTFSAQYGRAGGGIINAVTRSGGNEFHGSAYYFHRNDNLDARNFFDGAETPEFRRHQFGASLGGPVIRNRTFFFANYEGLREARGNTTIDTTLSDNAQNGLLATGTVRVDPSMAKALALYPRPNGQVFGDTGLFTFTNPEIASQNFITTRIDENLNSFDKLFFRYTLEGGARQNQTDYAVDSQQDNSRSQSLAVEESHIFSPALLNSARFGFARSHTVSGITQSLVKSTDDPDLAFLPNSGVVGVILVPGLTDFPGGSGAQDADIHNFNSFQGSDDLTYLRARHSIKIGVRVERTRFNTNSENSVSGEYRFAGIAQFLTNKPKAFRAQLPGSDTVRGYRQWIPAWYVEDTWKVSTRLSMTFGLRHEWNTVPDEQNGKLANMVNLTDKTLQVGQLFKNPSFKNFAPRAGFAWDPWGSGKTTVRGGYGIYHDLLLSQYLLFTGVRNPPFFVRGSISKLKTGDFPKGGDLALANTGTPELRVERLDPNPSQPYVQHWNFTIEQAAGRDAMLRLSYVGSRGLHLSSVTEDANLVTPVVQNGQIYFPPDGAKINPLYGQIRNRIFDASSFYNSLNAQYRHRFSRGVQVIVSYVFSKSIDDSSGYTTANEADNSQSLPFNTSARFNRGLSSFDVRHSFVASGTWELPSPFTGWRKAAIGGWQLGTIATYGSGLPMSARLGYDAAGTKTSRPDFESGQRPDLAPGTSNPVTGNPLQWVDTSAFLRPAPGTLGNVGRNTIIGPSLANVDFSLAKKGHVPHMGENAWLEFRAEFFNLLNHTNFNLPTADRMEIFEQDGVREDVGRITSAQNSREIQLGLKLRF